MQIFQYIIRLLSRYGSISIRTHYYKKDTNGRKIQNSLLFFRNARQMKRKVGWRKNMQDAAIHKIDIGDGNGVFAVFDGHGGAQVSEYVSKIFVDILKGTSQYASKDYKGALDITFKKVDQLIQSQQGAKCLHQIRYKATDNHLNYQSEKIANGSGCTANVILLTPDKYYVANAGDSRSCLCRKGKAVELSFDHKPQSAVQMARIKKAGGSIQMGRVNGGLNLSRSFADFDYKQNKNLDYSEQMITCKPDIKVEARTPDDQYIIMGCDGIWQKYVDNNQGMIDLVNKKMSSCKNIKAVVQGLLDDLIAQDTSTGLGCDNMTAILIKLK